MRNKTLNKKGVALVTVVLIFLVLVILLAGVMFAAVSNQRNSLVSKDNTSAYYTAESGLNVSIDKLDKFLTDNNYNLIPMGQYTTKMDALNTFITTDINGDTANLTSINPQGSYTIQATVGTGNTYTLRSIGTVNGITRTVEGTFSFTPIMENKAKAIIAKSTIDSKNGTIVGPIASLLSPAGSDIAITCNGSSGTNISEVYYPQPLPSGSTVSIDNKCAGTKTPYDVDETVVFNDFALPTYYTNTDTVVVGGVTKNVLVTITPTSNVYTFPALTEGQVGYYIAKLPTTNVTFNLGSGSTSTIYSLFVGDVDVSSNTNLGVGNIDVTGNGKLKMMITIDSNDYSNPNSSYQFTWNANVNNSLLTATNPDISKFQLVIKRGSGFASNFYPTFSITNSNVFVGSLMMDYINISFGNFNYKGFIATLGKSITISSNTDVSGPMWIYAPYANVSLSSNGIVNGAIIANSVEFNSGATLKYMQYTGPLPPELSLPLFIGGEPVPVGITFKFTNFREV